MARRPRASRPVTHGRTDRPRATVIRTERGT
ncbi:MAG: hypothetical protein JWO90_534, partial [Solirubrobacterales bacterium]|nr:hypothetical protein [Solirubrobacterales bacterium]